MELDLQLLASKLSRYRNQFQMSVEEVSAATGITSTALVAFENGTHSPTGDEILIIADFYKCDYRFFISNERLASFEQTETLFRKHGDELSRGDRWAIQEFLYLCERRGIPIDPIARPRVDSVSCRQCWYLLQAPR